MLTTRNPLQLLLVKQLYEDACALTSRGDDLSLSKAVILLDLSVEQMLNNLIMDFTASTSPKKPGRKDANWGELWGSADGAMQAKGHQPLVNHTQLLTLHEVRNLAQHNGTIPSQAETERYIEPAGEMLTKVFSEVYGQDFGTFRLWDLVSNGALRCLLSESETALGRGQPDLCIAGCNIAHKLIIGAVRNYAKIRRFRIPSGAPRGSGSSVNIPPGLPLALQSQLRSAARQMDDAIRSSVAKFRKEILAEIDYLEDEVVTIGVGMPLMDTRRFQQIGREAVPGPFYEDGNFDIFRGLELTDESELKRGATFMLNYLSRLVRLIDEAYPDVLHDVEMEKPLSSHPSWKAEAMP